MLLTRPVPKGSHCVLTHTAVSGITESWGLKLLCYLLCLQGSDTEEKESRSSVTSSPNDKQIDLALWLWQSKCHDPQHSIACRTYFHSPSTTHLYPLSILVPQCSIPPDPPISRLHTH